MASKRINSVGIDVGTTTTQIIFSQLELLNTAAASEVPRYEFSRRDVTYLSPVIFTPVDFEGRIRSPELMDFIVSQYSAAGLAMSDVESGAIIVTGETSKAANARDTVMQLAERLGDFVVATAGPHLESVISGHGSGAAEYSRKHSARVLNIDIGGGTSNYALFEAGKLADTACLNIGGHLIETGDSGEVLRVHQPARMVLKDCFSALPERVTNEHVEVAVNRMAELIVEVVEGRISGLASLLLMTPPLNTHAALDAVFISGGVGECFYSDESAQQDYGDIGPRLAAALRRHPALRAMSVRRPSHTLRATVIGAGAHTLSLSGSTIWLDFAALPIRNVPVLHASDSATKAPEDLVHAWKANAQMQDIALDVECYALAIPLALPVTYRSVQLCAAALQLFMAECRNVSYPLIVISRQDFGMALGMELQPCMRQRELAVIDEVETREWDYIDIGKGLFGDTVVPLTVKSLAFPS
ncbi:ethanolamine ammonia-lyase reactivating factor EutA [Noviherbaspirillum saxi]|uniref:Ethanolamine utilization protein EutA n=1 Tax=Noviherbaspirillum saxi TaxID=2320863 RepID=A0A3A3FFN3_9BURK|nr:ethanolamine ammonia-lyase reactivating factor EutA [Noviherbaspirillum saxi]RJF92060.1 ethanolamine utilization protein EutA [Noviherbaspirillum saxi]